jgi:hypothetical protein
VDVTVGLGHRVGAPGTFAGRLYYRVTWPGGSGRELDHQDPSKMGDRLERCLALLEPDVRAESKIRAQAVVWAKAGGLRMAAVGDWTPNDRVALSEYVTRVRKACAALGEPRRRRRVVGWIDEADVSDGALRPPNKELQRPRHR